MHIEFSKVFKIMICAHMQHRTMQKKTTCTIILVEHQLMCVHIYNNAQCKKCHYAPSLLFKTSMKLRTTHTHIFSLEGAPFANCMRCQFALSFSRHDNLVDHNTTILHVSKVARIVRVLRWSSFALMHTC